MIAGHFGFAAAVKAREPQVPLWSLMLATVWLDVVFVPLLLGKIETLEPAPGAQGGYGGNIIHADYTHSLAGALALSAIFGLIFLPRWGGRNAAVLGLVAFSHWLLDLLTHRADLPLLPGDAGHLPKLGFGLWRIAPAAMAVEAVLVVAGAWLYWRAADELTHAGRRAATARLSAALILIFGLGVLALDVTGVLG